VGAFDVGVTSSNAVAIRSHGTSLPLRFRAGGIVDNVAAHARKMGLPPAPPRWALAPMQWRNDLEVELDAEGNVVSSGVDMLLADVEEMRARNIPTSTLWIDAPWETGYNTFVFNEQQLPEIDSVLSALRARGFRILTWATEHVNNSDDSDQAFGMPALATREMFNEYDDAGFLVSTTTGAPFEFPWGRGNGGYVDFTNPAACDAWRGEIRPMLERGVNGFKLDYGETMRADVLGQLANDLPVFSDGTTTQVQHTRYARLYHECYLQALDEVHGAERFVITRTGGIFDQKNGTAIWPGDLDSEFERTGEPDANGEAAVGGIPAAVNGFLSLQMSAYPLYGADVGGYRGGTPTTEAFVRWAQAGALSTVMQVGGGGNQAAWDAELVDVIDAFTVAARVHMDLVPMWEHWLARSAQGGDGTPVAVPVGVVADTSEAWADEATYVLGDALLAAPVVEAGARTRDVFVPAGRWRSWWDGGLVEGPALVTVDAPLERVPLYQRENAILVLAHPRIVTLLPNGDEPGGDDDMGALRVVRVMSGATAAQATVGDIIAARTVDGSTLRVDVLADAPRPLVIDLWLDEPFTLVTAGEQVADEDALLTCSSTCVLLEEKRVRLAGTGRDLALEVELE
jgi:alpha-D-xyloside xylohydrolase